MMRDVTESRAVPWWRVVDVLCVLLVGLGVIVEISGGFRQSIGAIRFSVTSALPLLLWAIGLGAVRHLVAPQHPIYREFPAAAVRSLRRSPVRAAATTVGTTRLAIFLVGCFAVYTFGYSTPDVPVRLFENEVLNLAIRWDAGWYLQIVTDGYRFTADAPDTQQNIVFFPAYPLLVRIVGRLFGGHTPGYVAAAMVVSLASFFGALVYLYVLARDFVDDERARYALWLLASYPFAVFFGVIYTESLFLLAAVAAFYHMTRAQFGRAMGWGLLVGLTKANGAALCVPLAMLAIRVADAQPLVHRFDPAIDSLHRSTAPGQTTRAIVAAAMPAMGLLIFSIFLWRLTGDPLAWARGQAAWGRTYEPITHVVGRQYSYLTHGGLNAYMATGAYDVLNMVAAVFALAAVWPVARRLGAAYAALILVVLVPPIATGGWLSVGRFSSVLFPIFVWLAASIPESHRQVWIVGFATFQALNAALFFTWRPLI